jgi:prepilin-type N-terminal cleavage/methylation domain-containing protein
MSLTARPGRRPRGGYTLLEVIVVMAVLAVLFTMIALFFPNFQGRQQAESGASSLSGWLLIAKQQAKRDGRPTGLRFIPLTGNANFVTQMQYIQQPDDFAIGTYTGPSTSNTIAQFTGVDFTQTYSIAGSSEPFQVQAGDYLEIYGGGPLRRIAPGGVGKTTLTLEMTTTPLPTAPSSAATATNYRIIPRARTLSGDVSLSLPNTSNDPNYPSVVIDFGKYASVNNNKPLSNAPQVSGQTYYEILFAPSGAVIGDSTTLGQIYLWVHDGSQKATNQLQGGTVTAGTPTLICVQTRTGFIAAQAVNPDATDPFAFARDARSSGM